MITCRAWKSSEFRSVSAAMLCAKLLDPLGSVELVRLRRVVVESRASELAEPGGTGRNPAERVPRSATKCHDVKRCHKICHKICHKMSMWRIQSFATLVLFGQSLHG